MFGTSSTVFTKPNQGSEFLHTSTHVQLQLRFDPVQPTSWNKMHSVKALSS
jgi:hypothetical protein